MEDHVCVSCKTVCRTDGGNLCGKAEAAGLMAALIAAENEHVLACLMRQDCKRDAQAAAESLADADRRAGDARAALTVARAAVEARLR